MIILKKIAIAGIFLSCVGVSISETHSDHSEKVLPTHADAALVLAKYSGLFDRHVSLDATLSDCVSFFNKQGVYFGLLEVVNPTEFKVRDCARVMGQIELVLAGEAEYLAGKVIMPKGIDSWEEFCIMNQVDYIKAYESIVQTLVWAVRGAG